ncbi:uncharacterized protein LOC116338302 [Contarinia nasturtii]|uniref:uncharacterized protein LOC116338302 n=1 Tax=Contarinia nasturtii TaxID=265458 RepID=UPI0012D47BF7|nr:uncharacterized protein LOC116338302 [Contarinia nasturtii]
MDRITYYIFALLVFASLINCDDLKMQANNSSSVNKSDKQSLIDLFIDLFGIYHGVLPNDDERSNSVPFDTDSPIDPHISRVIQEISLKPVIAPYLEPVRTYIKRAYKTYVTLTPEVKLGQCVVKHFYVQYPSIFRFFRNNTLRKHIDRVYNFLVQWIRNLLKILFPLEIEQNTSQIGPKVANKRIKMPPQSLANTPSQPNYNYYYPSSLNPTVYSYRSKRQTNAAQITNNKMESEAQIDMMNRRILEREADDLFNMDQMLWKNFGLDDRSIKKYSMVYCGKEWITGFFNRFVKNVILS